MTWAARSAREPSSPSAGASRCCPGSATCCSSMAAGTTISSPRCVATVRAGPSAASSRSPSTTTASSIGADEPSPPADCATPENRARMHDSYLITGGAGFIGTNLAMRYLERGRRVTIFDNFSRPGTHETLHGLVGRYGNLLRVIEGDVRRRDARLERAVEEVDVVFHLAAQVAVTTSVADPLADFEVNALGTLNVLESVRRSAARPIVVYSSTNKVYGKLANAAVCERGGRYAYRDLPTGIPESTPLDFHSPYGCSKGAGDQYVLDYARIFGLRTLCFRQACVYGPHQFGNEDQGWVAWFAIRALQGRPITIFGDGRQVRDVLYVDDLAAAYDAAIAAIDRTSGEVFNIGGGPENALSLLELVERLEREFGLSASYAIDDWRVGDQRVYISDIRKAEALLGWRPRVGLREGLARLVGWLQSHQHLFSGAPTRQFQQGATG